MALGLEQHPDERADVGGVLDDENARHQTSHVTWSESGPRTRAVRMGISAPGETTDVFTLIPEYNEPRRFLKLADDLVRRGWKPSRGEKVLGANFARLFGDVWAA